MDSTPNELLARLLATCRVLLIPGDVAEVRILGEGKGVVSGYFNDPKQLAAAVLLRNGRGQIYVTFNPVNPVRPDAPDLVVDNRLHDDAHNATSDEDIARRKWMLIDHDPKRKAKTASTDLEHTEALQRAVDCEHWLREELGFPASSIIRCDSGNGAHLLVRIDLPNDDEAKDLIIKCLQVVALEYGDDEVGVDQTVFNSSRITRCYGSTNIKGPNTVERPHRDSKILSQPETVEIVPRSLLEKLAARVPEEPKTERTNGKKQKGVPLDVATWLSDHAIACIGPTPWLSDATKYVLPVCPFNPDHDNKSAVVIQFGNGALAFKCHHDGCAGKDWPALREHVEPGWQVKRDAQVVADAHTKLDKLVDEAKETKDPGVAFQAIDYLVGLSAADHASYRAKFREALGQKLNLKHFDHALADAKKEAAPDRKNPVIRLAAHILEGHHFARNEGQQLYHFEEGHYVRDGDIAIQRLVKESLTDWGEIDSWSSFRGREVFNYILTGAQQLWTHRPPDEIPVLDGILNLRTITLRPHDPAFLSPIQFPVIFDPDARCEKIDKFFEEVFPKGAADLGYEIIASILDPEFYDQKADLLNGPGGSGKSAYLALVTKFIGSENVSNLSLHTLENNRFAVAELYGKVANICPDLPSTRLSHTSIFKRITGGDKVEAEIKNGRFFSFAPYARLLFGTNHLPRADDADEAFYQRLHVIPFDNVFRGLKGKEIKRNKLDAMLSDPAQLSGMLNKVLEVLPGLRANGFTQCQSTERALDDFRAETDPVAVWLDKNTVETPTGWVAKDMLLKAYNAAAEATHRPPQTANNFGRAVTRFRPAVTEKQKRVFGRRVWVWRGIGLGTPESDQSAPHKEECHGNLDDCHEKASSKATQIDLTL